MQGNIFGGIVSGGILDISWIESSTIFISTASGVWEKAGRDDPAWYSKTTWFFVQAEVDKWLFFETGNGEKQTEAEVNILRATIRNE